MGPRGDLIPRRTGWLTVGRNATSTSINSSDFILWGRVVHTISSLCFQLTLRNSSNALSLHVSCIWGHHSYFWDITPYSSVKHNWCSWRTYRIYLAIKQWTELLLTYFLYQLWPLSPFIKHYFIICYSGRWVGRYIRPFHTDHIFMSKIHEWQMLILMLLLL